MSESGPARQQEARIDSAYYQAVLAKPLHFVYEALGPHLRPPGVAVDLGCGVGTATLFLLERGFEVYSVDLSEEAISILQSRLPEGARAHPVVADMMAFPIPECDVVTAGFSLFFLSQDQLAEFWPRLIATLRPGGLFAGQFLGPNDEWADKGHALVDEQMLREMFAGFELIHFEEVDREGETSVGNPKHWHVFHVVARKREGVQPPTGATEKPRSVRRAPAAAPFRA